MHRRNPRLQIRIRFSDFGFGISDFGFDSMPRSSNSWIADRMQHVESSGIRKVFDLARSIKNPINLSIGQPHFDVPPAIKAAAIAAIQRGENAYTVTQGIS